MKDDGGPAFPRAPFEYADKGLDWEAREQRGMALRDWLAGQAVSGIIAATSAGRHFAGENMPNRDEATMAARIAFDAYEMADAMLAARDA